MLPACLRPKAHRPPLPHGLPGWGAPACGCALRPATSSSQRPSCSPGLRARPRLPCAPQAHPLEGPGSRQRGWVRGDCCATAGPNHLQGAGPDVGRVDGAWRHAQRTSGPCRIRVHSSARVWRVLPSPCVRVAPNAFRSGTRLSSVATQLGASASDGMHALAGQLQDSQLHARAAHHLVSEDDASAPGRAQAHDALIQPAHAVAWRWARGVGTASPEPGVCH